MPPSLLRPAAAVFAAALVAAAPLHAAPTKTLTTLRVMLNPDVAPAGMSRDDARARLERVAGVPLAVTGTTRTGALELTLAGPRDPASLAAVAQRLRNDRAVLWAETRVQKSVTTKSNAAHAAARMPAQKLLVALQPGSGDWSAVGPRLAALAGAPLSLERTLAHVQVLALPEPRTVADLDTMARRLEQDPAVRYADTVRRVFRSGAPNDPLYPQQWSLGVSGAGINAEAAWALGTGSPGITVAVVDTGILPHPDLAGRLLPGFDFIADADRARDGDGRDPDPRDEGDWLAGSDCGGYPAQDSFWHGLFVAGQIAANANDGLGVAGLDWSAKLLPVRALGKCGGTYEDVLAAILWSAGVPLAGVPANPNPARVINLSLGGYGSCAGALQEAVDQALAQGTIVVAAAGNETDDALAYAPGNCSGVVNVGALARDGQRASYSNYGTRIDVSAPGGDIDVAGAIVSTFNSGTTTPGDADYTYAVGTSFAAPLVSGTAALMLARNPNLTAGQVLSTLQGTARDFPAGSACGSGRFCGAGMLDTGLAVASTVPAAVNLPPYAVAIVEYYDGVLDHYFITADPAEMAMLDATAGPRAQRTGHVFYGYADPGSAAPGVTVRNVCRFYAGPEQLIDSHWFSADPAECAFVLSQWAGVWRLQTEAAFWIEVPGTAGTCREGTLPVYRFFNNRRDANHRHTIDLAVRRGMINRAWVPDGPGANGAAFCSLI